MPGMPRCTQPGTAPDQFPTRPWSHGPAPAEAASPQVADETVPQEHGPVAVSFDELMPKTLATATVDRLLHHAHVAQTSGESVRLSQALAGHGVTPLGGTR